MLLATLLPASLMADSQKKIQDELQSLSHQIVYVSTFGQWQANGRKGIHRLVLIDAKAPYPHSKLFIQWISAKNNDEVAELIAVKAINEINLAAVYQLALPTADKSGNNTIELRGINQYAHTMQEFSITPTLPGEYRFAYGNTNPAGTDNKNISNQVERAIRNLPVTLDFYSRPTF